MASEEVLNQVISSSPQGAAISAATDLAGSLSQPEGDSFAKGGNVRTGDVAVGGLNIGSGFDSNTVLIAAAIGGLVFLMRNSKVFK